MARGFAVSAEDARRMQRMASEGLSATAIGRMLNVNTDTVMNTVRRLIPSAFSRSARTAPAPAVNDNIEIRRMPHHVSWSTDPVQSHAISLPRLKCLQAA